MCYYSNVQFHGQRVNRDDHIVDIWLYCRWSDLTAKESHRIVDIWLYCRWSDLTAKESHRIVDIWFYCRWSDLTAKESHGISNKQKRNTDQYTVNYKAVEEDGWKQPYIKTKTQ